MTETERKGTDGAERAANAYTQWLESCERLTDVWLRMMADARQGRGFTEAMRGMMDAAASAGGAAPAGGPQSGADAFAAWRDMRDRTVQSWSTMMANAVNTPGYAEAMGSMLGANAAMGEPLEKAVEASMSRTLHQMNMPTRSDITKVLERLTHIEKRLDDLAAER